MSDITDASMKKWVKNMAFFFFLDKKKLNIQYSKHKGIN